MAQSWAATFKAAVPLPSAVGIDSGTEPACLCRFSLTGPASSVAAGMAISGLSDDLTSIAMGWLTDDDDHTYKFAYKSGTGDLIANGKIHATVMSTGTSIADSVDLSSLTLTLIAIGTGPLASAVD